MSLDSNGDNGMVMPVQPMSYGGYGGGYGYPAVAYPAAVPMYGFGGGYGGGYGGMGGFGGDNWLIILFLFAMMGGWGGFGGFGGMGGLGGMMGGANLMMWPWLMTNQTDNLVTNGFNNSGIASTLAGIQNGVTSGFGDVQLGLANVNQNVSTTGAGIQNSLCNGFAGVNQSICNGANAVTTAVTGAQNALAHQMYGNQIADLERSFTAQTANVAGLNGVQAQIAQTGYNNQNSFADLKYTVATENCADRTAAANNTRDIIDSQTRGTQAILDKLCALELDNVKGQLAQAQRDNVGLQNALNMANMRESQTAQTAQILAGQTAEVDALYNRLSNCPVPTTPVYGRTPIFTCNNGCGCNGNNAFVA